MLKIIFSLLRPLLIIATISSAQAGNEIIEQLQKNLILDYLPKLEKKWGACGSDPSACLTLIDQQYVELNLPEKKDICFPNTYCGFYTCMEKKYKCDEVGVHYFSQLAYPTCSAYVKNINLGLFSKQGVEWVYKVMVCLQKGLIDECDYLGNCQPNDDLNNRKKVCDHITEFTLSFHPGCYTKSGVGVCRLPLKDKLQIWKTVSPYLTKRERQEAYKVIFSCLKSNIQFYQRVASPNTLANDQH